MAEAKQTPVQIEIADQIEIRLLDLDSGEMRRYKSTVTDLSPTTVSVAMPADQRRPVHIDEGTEVIVAIWKEIGWETIIYLAALSGIPAEQYEAAVVDGASKWQQLIYITLPSIAPTIGLMFIFTIAHLVTNSPISFGAIYNMRNALVSEYSDTLDYYIFLQGIRRVRYGIATAMGLLRGLAGLVLVLGANGISRRIRKYGAF